jgi:hypothetical protein
VAERTAERAAGEQALGELRAELARVRADAAAEVGAAQQQTRAVQALAEQRSATYAPSGELLSVPIPPWEVRAAAHGIENVLSALHQLNYTLEVAMVDGVETRGLDTDLVHSLVETVQQQSGGLLQELRDLAATPGTASEVEAAGDYATAATMACQLLLQRISTAAKRVQHRDSGASGEVVRAVIGMLTDSRVQGLFEQLFASGGRL